MRPDHLIAIAGTGTDVGKTWVARGLVAGLRGTAVTVAVRKPAQSFAPGDDDAGVTDAHLLAVASGEDPRRVTPPHRWYPAPLAPPMAADVLGLPAFGVADLVRELEQSWDSGARIGIIETAGGLRSPIADDGDCLDLILAARVERVVLVADAGLGVIHDVRVCAAALADVHLPVIVMLNRFAAAAPYATHARNAAWLARREGLDVVTDIEALTARCATA